MLRFPETFSFGEPPKLDMVFGIKIACLWAAVVFPGCLADILISEINSDNPYSDTAEFVELWNPDDCRRSLDGYTLVLFNGFVSPPAAYSYFDLSGRCIEGRGYFVIGSSEVSPTPDFVAFGPNALQNGMGNADSVALYKNYHGMSANE